VKEGAILSWGEASYEDLGVVGLSMRGGAAGGGVHAMDDGITGGVP